MATTKTACPITLAAFLAAAPTVRLTVERPEVDAEDRIVAAPRQFSTGNLGLWAQDKVKISVGGQDVKCQFQATITLLGSGFMSEEQKSQALAAMKPLTLGLHVGDDEIDGPRVYDASGTGARQFSTGSFGWNFTAKIDAFQLGVNVTVVGSKEAPRA